MRVYAIWLGSMLLAVAPQGWAQTNQTSSVVDGFGTRSTGSGFTHIGAGAQPGGITTSHGSGFINQAGFLNTFFLKSGLDTDGDGIPDEADADNDGDRLTDLDELGGGQFNPSTPTDLNIADTDGDGHSDFEEMLAGTDPTAVGSLLRIIATDRVGPHQVVTWPARGNSERIYVVRARTDSYAQPNVVIFSNSLPGGVAPWYGITNSLNHATTTGAVFYSVEAIKP